MEPEVKTLSEPDFNYAGLYTYADYLTWTIEERLELIKGKIFPMSAPNLNHQIIARDLFGPLYNHLKDQRCQAFIAPFDVRLPRKSRQDKDVITVVQPDLCVVCDEAKLDHHGCVGAPDLVVEILSPTNSKKEIKNKYEVYEESGVKEYWVVYPGQRVVQQYRLNADGIFIGLRPLAEDDWLETSVLPGFRLAVSEIFLKVRD